MGPNLGFCFFLHISDTYHPIFNFDTSTSRSSLELHFIVFDLRALANLWDVISKKLHFHRFLAYIPLSVAPKLEVCLHHTVMLLKCYISYSGC